MHEQFNTSHSIRLAIIAPSFLRKDSVPLSLKNISKGSSARETDCEESKCNRVECDGIICNGKPHF